MACIIVNRRGSDPSAERLASAASGGPSEPEPELASCSSSVCAAFLSWRRPGALGWLRDPSIDQKYA